MQAHPTTANTASDCTGTETGGLVVGSSGSSVAVEAGATVNAPAGVNTIAVTPLAQPNVYSDLYASISVNGTVGRGSASGIRVTAPALQPGGYLYLSTQATVTVGAAGSITGSTGIVASATPGNNYGAARVAVDNSGSITGTSYALQSDATRLSYFSSIVNRSGGQIGAISAVVDSLTNAGTIDGGGLSAVQFKITPNYNSGGTMTNSGTIKSASAVATVTSGGYVNVTNSGTIINSGSGPAVQAASTLSLTNRGIITGNVVAGSDVVNSYSGSTIDNSGGGGGTINGGISLGSGKNTLIVDFGTAAAPVVGITGTIDLGGGSNTLRLVFAVDTTLTTPVTIPSGFATVSYDIGSKATLTLDSSYAGAMPVVLTGAGSFVNAGKLATNGAAILANAAARSQRRAEAA